MVPRINDITTDFESPPSFEEIARRNPKRDYSYPRRFAGQQLKGYPDLKPLVIAAAPAKVFQWVEAAAQTRTDWTVVAMDRSRLRMEAVATTKWLRFRDDVVIEVRPGPGAGATIQMRSKSRLGRSDLGANARRIREFWEAILALARPQSR